MNTPGMRTQIGVLVVGFLGFWSVAEGKVVYVSRSGSDAKDGLSWAKAKLTVQAGLNAAVAGDEVWVAKGTYVECVTLKAGASLYGGFAGTETVLAQRNRTANETILDGNAVGTVVTSPSGATSTTRLDGLTIRNCKATTGVGVLCGGGSSPTIANNIITANAGCGVLCSSSSAAVITNNTIAANVGGIDCLSSYPTITGNTITGNTIAGNASAWCGGIRCQGCESPIAITFNTIADNSSMTGGAGIEVHSLSSVTITNNTILRNTTMETGGGVFVGRAASLVVANNLVAENVAYSGGGLHCFATAMTISNNTIVCNSVTRDGGGIYMAGDAATISNNLIAYNSSGLFTSAKTSSIGFCCVYGNLLYDYSGLSNPTGSNGNISVNPGLANMPYGNMHLRVDSPCVDAGDSTVVQTGWTDIDGQPRIAGTRVDIGADESDRTVWPTGPAVIVRVNPEGNDVNDGSSWPLAKKSVQAAIDAASVQGGDVWVKAGTYAEVVTLRSRVHVYGGFAGTETTREQRNWRVHVSTLARQSQDPGVKTACFGRLMGTLDGFTIRGNPTSKGTGIGCNCASPTIANNMITGNRGASGDWTYGGGIQCWMASPTIVANSIFGNIATDGSGISCSYSSPAIINNTIAWNTASSSGGGIFFRNGCSPIVLNTIVAFNSSGIAETGIKEQSLRFNCVYGNTAYNYSGLTDPTGTDGNISADPQFVLPPAPGTDGQWGTADDVPGNLHLKPRSPCIDAGDRAIFSTLPVVLPDGFLLFFNDPFTPDTGKGTAPIVDMGAFEYIPGDLDWDGDIDGDDLTAFAACASGMSIPYASGCAGADVDKDNDVDLADFSFIQRWLSGSGKPADPTWIK